MLSRFDPIKNWYDAGMIIILTNQKISDFTITTIFSTMQIDFDLGITKIQTVKMPKLTKHDEQTYRPSSDITKFINSSRCVYQFGLGSEYKTANLAYLIWDLIFYYKYDKRAAFSKN